MRRAFHWAMPTAWRGIETAAGSGPQPQVCPSALPASSSPLKLSVGSLHLLDLIIRKFTARGSLAGVCQDSSHSFRCDMSCMGCQRDTEEL